MGFIFKLANRNLSLRLRYSDASSLAEVARLSLSAVSLYVSHPSLSLRKGHTMTTCRVVFAAVSMRTDLQTCVKRGARRVAEDLQCSVWTSLYHHLPAKSERRIPAAGGLDGFHISSPGVSLTFPGQRLRETEGKPLDRPEELCPRRNTAHIESWLKDINTVRSGKCGCIHHGGL